MRTALLATVLVLGALSLAGCGDDVDPKAYIQQVSQVQGRTVSDVSARSKDLAASKTARSIATQLDGLGSAVQRNAKRLGTIDAPEEVQAQHERYVELLTGYGGDVRALAARVRTAEPAEANRLLRRASSLTAELATRETAVVRQINERLR